jgi:hypothetical protein
MRVVYEIKNQLNEWKQQQSEAEEAAADARANSRKLESGAKPEKTSGSKPGEKQQ